MRQFLINFHHLRRFVWPNKAAARPTASDPKPMTWFNFDFFIQPFTAQYFGTPPWRRNHWILDILAVHPAHQGHGYGRELTAWGISRAVSDQIPVVVVASEGQDTFYRRCGFSELAGWASKAKDPNGKLENPLAKRGVGGGAILWTPMKEDKQPEATESP
jgi:GNAT superfamily N-acetyltransferase